MLTRIHVDNFRCLVNFDLKLDRLNLLLGDNGNGKTTVFEVLRRLQGFLSGKINVDTAFPPNDLTRWQQLDIQRFELELKSGNDTYLYSLSIHHDRNQRLRRMIREDLLMNQKALFEFKLVGRVDATAQLYHDDFRKGPLYPSDWSRSGVASLQARPDNTKLTRFRQEIGKLVVVNLCPPIMDSESAREESQLDPSGKDFPSWYRHLAQLNPNNVWKVFQELQHVLPGFDSLSLREAGEETRVLKVLFQREPPPKEPHPFNFGELSDGQRQLIVLYCLLYGLKNEGYSLFLDEPDNYVALREIQPWLTALQNSCGSSISQGVLISHHPEIINHLAGSATRWFDRPDGGPSRVLDQTPTAVDGLTPSETIASGWTP